MNSNLFRRTMEPATDAGFSFINYMDTKKATSIKHFNWRPARLSKGKKWYASFQYLSPETGKMIKFKVYENINRIHDKEEKEQYGKDLVEAINRALKEGLNPFVERQKVIVAKTWTVQQAFSYFKQKWSEKGIEESSVRIYNSTVNRFTKWAIQKGIQNDDISSVNETVVELYLDELKKKNEWSNRSFNNERNFLRTIFIFLCKKQITKINPCADIQLKKVITKKHRYYDEKTMAKVLKYLKENDPYLYFACQVVYYLCIRSEKELKLFKVGNILPDRKQVLINGSDSKTSKDRFIPMPDEMISVFRDRKIFDYPGNCYVFSAPHKNKFIKDGSPGTEPFGKGFFSERFSRIRSKIGIDKSYTIYGFKHTRIIHLKLDGVQDQDIMALTGHSNYLSFSHYLRDLGLTVNAETINNKTRKL